MRRPATAGPRRSRAPPAPTAPSASSAAGARGAPPPPPPRAPPAARRRGCGGGGARSRASPPLAAQSCGTWSPSRAGRASRHAAARGTLLIARHRSPSCGRRRAVCPVPVGAGRCYRRGGAPCGRASRTRRRARRGRRRAAIPSRAAPPAAARPRRSEGRPLASRPRGAVEVVRIGAAENCAGVARPNCAAELRAAPVTPACRARASPPPCAPPPSAARRRGRRGRPPTPSPPPPPPRAARAPPPAYLRTA